MSAATQTAAPSGDIKGKIIDALMALAAERAFEDITLTEIAREAGIRAQVSHLKLSGPAAWGRTDEVLRANIPFAFHPSRQRDEALLQAYFEMIARAGAAQLVRQNRALMARPDSRPLLRRLRCPLLVACGDTDALTPPECSR